MKREPKFKPGDRVKVGVIETAATVVKVRIYSDLIECDVLFDGNPTTYPYEDIYLTELPCTQVD